jgi:hypothetical protein
VAEPSPEFRRLSEDSVRRRTGKGWAEWLSILDDWGAREHGPEAAARYLGEEHGLGPWWARAVAARHASERVERPRRVRSQ